MKDSATNRATIYHTLQEDPAFEHHKNAYQNL